MADDIGSKLEGYFERVRLNKDEIDHKYSTQLRIKDKLLQSKTESGAKALKKRVRAFAEIKNEKASQYAEK